MTCVRDLEGCPWAWFDLDIRATSSSSSMSDERWARSQTGPTSDTGDRRHVMPWYQRQPVARWDHLYFFYLSFLISLEIENIEKSKWILARRWKKEASTTLVAPWYDMNLWLMHHICLRVTVCLSHQTMSHQKIPRDFPAPHLHPPGESCDKVKHHLIYLKHLSYCDADAFPKRDGFALTPDTVIRSKITHSIQNSTPARLQVKYRGGVHQRTIGLCPQCNAYASREIRFASPWLREQKTPITTKASMR